MTSKDPSKNQGFINVNEARGVVNVSINDSDIARKIIKDKILSDFEVDELVKEALLQRLINKLHEKGYISFSKTTSHLELQDTYHVDINVAPHGTHFVGVIGEAFIVDKEKFNEEELIEAVKIAYPERFI